LSYNPESGDRIKSQNIPVYSFRYKRTFNKSEEKEYSKTITYKHAMA
jgi:hypothetical protein